MTCTVAFKHNKKVYIGADSLASNDAFQKVVRLDRKVFIKDDMIFGFAGSFRMGQILQYVMETPEHKASRTDIQYLIRDWIPALIDCFEDSGFRGDMTEHDHHETRTGGEFLIGYRGNIYQVESDFQVGIPADEFTAIGSGGDVALGALHALTNLQLPLEPEVAITKALTAAEHFSAAVQRPFHILSL